MQLTAAVVEPGSLSRCAQPRLVAGDLGLRPWRHDDAPVIVAAYADPVIQHWHARSMNDPSEAVAWIESRIERWSQERGADWAIVDESGVLGRMAVRRLELEAGLAEVGYWVLPHARGRRVASRALCGLCDWLFDEVGLHRIELMHSKLNPASCRVAHLASFRLEGTKRQEGLHEDGWHDMHLHARLAGDLTRAAGPWSHKGADARSMGPAAS
jgi:[ribosomal protein S5]-alanine N-acetyltransferase